MMFTRAASFALRRGGSFFVRLKVVLMVGVDLADFTVAPMIKESVSERNQSQSII